MGGLPCPKLFGESNRRSFNFFRAPSSKFDPHQVGHYPSPYIISSDRVFSRATNLVKSRHLDPPPNILVCYGNSPDLRNDKISLHHRCLHHSASSHIPLHATTYHPQPLHHQSQRPQLFPSSHLQLPDLNWGFPPA